MAWENSHASAQDQPVSVLLAHRDLDRTAAWYQALQMDARFRVTSMANTAQDLRVKLASSPEVVLLDAAVFDGPQQLTEALTSVAGSVYLIVPGGVEGELLERLRSIPSVKHIALVDMNIADFMSKAYGQALALRKSNAPLNSSAWAPSTSARSSGLRIISLWSRSGGSGRTTLAVSLAQAVARRGIKTLLIGLGSPDVLPLHLGLKAEPNIVSWIANPTDDSLRACIQSAGELHVLAGFPDILSESQADRAPESGGSLSALVTAAAYSGYTAILLDTPSSGPAAPRALSAANTWLLVARPTVADVWTAAESFRTVTQKIAGEHRITPGNIFVALNARENGMLTADQWHSAADAACRRMNLNVGFPPVMASIPHSLEAALAQDSGRSALDASDDFARPVHRLAEMLFGQKTMTEREEGVFRLGPLKIRTAR